MLVTELHGPDGVVELTDALTLRSGADLAEDAPAGRGELLRTARVLAGRVKLQVEIQPRAAGVEARGGGLRIRPTGRSDLELHLFASAPLDGPRCHLELRAGDQLQVILRWRPGAARSPAIDFDRLLDGTRAVWRAWARHIAYDGPQQALVRRSAITLKLLDHVANGAILAAPTSSLPEAIGGPRNWDYRYAWIRDAAFSVYALRRIGLAEEAAGFLAWVLDAVDRHGHPRVLYDLDGKTPPTEVIDTGLEGYRKSSPVRWGNAAAEQRQHDVYGEILDCAFSGPLRAAGSTSHFGGGWRALWTPPPGPGPPRTTASGRSAPPAGCSPIPPLCARSRWTVAPAWLNASGAGTARG